MSTAVLTPLFNSLLGIAITVILGLVGAAVNKYVKNADARVVYQFEILTPRDAGDQCGWATANAPAASTIGLSGLI